MPGQSGLASPDAHAMPYAYAFVGLTPSERALLASIFGLEGDGMIRVRSLDDADLLLANGDDQFMVRQLRQTNPGALLVLVGEPTSMELRSLPILPRPLELGNVLRVLSALDWPSPRQDSQPVTVTSIQTFSSADLSASQWPVSDVWAPAESAQPGESRAHDSEAQPTQPQPLPTREGNWYGLPANANADVLVVVGPHVGPPHTLALGLRRLGYLVAVAEGGEQALQAMERRPAAFVFLDQISLGEQLMPLARALAATRPERDGRPHLIVVARRANLFDRLRARLLGCIWMPAPVHARRIVAFFSHRGLEPRH